MVRRDPRRHLRSDVLAQNLGFLSRFAPQLNVFFLALPLKVLVLTIMLLLYGLVLASGGYLGPVADFGAILEPLRRALP